MPLHICQENVQELGNWLNLTKPTGLNYLTDIFNPLTPVGNSMDEYNPLVVPTVEIYQVVFDVKRHKLKKITSSGVINHTCSTDVKN